MVGSGGRLIIAILAALLRPLRSVLVAVSVAASVIALLVARSVMPSAIASSKESAPSIPTLEPQCNGILGMGHSFMESKKKRLVVKENRDTFPPKRAIFIDDELFDWEIDSDSLEKARKMGPQIYAAAVQDIQKHFMDSLSDFMGREITVQEFSEATRTGWL